MNEVKNIIIAILGVLLLVVSWCLFTSNHAACQRIERDACVIDSLKGEFNVDSIDYANDLALENTDFFDVWEGCGD